MHEHNQFLLLRERRFLPFFLTQALGAFNDNVFRNATVLLIGFEMGLSTEQITTYSNVAPALFILPFFLFSASADPAVTAGKSVRSRRSTGVSPDALC